MLIYFNSNKLQKICSKQKEAIKYLGVDKAKKLQQRMMELSAADCLADVSTLRPTRCHPLKGNRSGQFSVDLDHPYRLIFVPAIDVIPEKEGIALDLSQINAIEIIDILDTH